MVFRNQKIKVRGDLRREQLGRENSTWLPHQTEALPC